MTARRSPSDTIIGVWLAIAAAGLPVVGIVWGSYIPKLFLREPVPPHVFIAFVIVGLSFAVSVVAVIEDIWERPLVSDEQVMWTLLTAFAPPYGGLAYWVARCHSTPPPNVGPAKGEPASGTQDGLRMSHLS